MGTLKIGDRAKYKRAFLKSISCFTGDLPFAVGTIQDLKQLSPKFVIATVAWDGCPPSVPSQVNMFNLVGAKIGEAE